MLIGKLNFPYKVHDIAFSARLKDTKYIRVGNKFDPRKIIKYFGYCMHVLWPCLPNSSLFADQVLT